MTSHRIEVCHSADLKKLLLEAGVVCARTVAQSEESSLSSEETVKDVPGHEIEAEHEEIVVHEESTYPTEEITEEQPEIFPTPSLRKMLPDKIRMIEKHNRIHVLPEVFKTDIDPMKIPRILNTHPQKYINDLAEITGCKNYMNSLAEFWFLDTLANLLRRAQEDGFEKPSQVVLIQWFCEWMKEIQHFDAATRQRMLKRFKDTMLLAAGYLAQYDELPVPADVGVSYKPEETAGASLPPTATASKQLVTFENFQCCLTDLTKIIHYIFDLFSSDFQYDLIRSVFTFTPEYRIIDAPHTLQQPKRFFTTYKPKPKEKAPKKEKEQKTAKGKKKEVESEQFLHLIQLQNEIEREKEEELEKEREDWHRRSHLLPLAFAVTDEFFDKYWPPPTPEIVSIPEPEPKGKGKKK
ncbi:PREDICTED: uncharacterized protein LOC106116346 [Papilio xuthus]|uniref:Uncharacterized protein LOC106116346 n=1 Tax=Papilio xuthus TaxID=66420 RepID=A0AAJ7E731_PAPXU|nr:PREDICTED: uncharacterized protein LOC106116346 [Papilio xuthus]XP_013165589.1 PREDICTED: uncharacterized protein LOC106116346 [Papilio xuthus]XP_013165590.1 PREDICTED: uncharacterized protein LOC106116346 [Papilio xuthus]